MRDQFKQNSLISFVTKNKEYISIFILYNCNNITIIICNVSEKEEKKAGTMFVLLSEVKNTIWVIQENLFA